jgi:glucose/arabinose dehydrogenase
VVSVRGSLIAAGIALLVAVAGCGEDETTTTEPAGEPAPTGDAGRAQAPPIGDGRGGVRLVEIGRFEAPLYVAQPPGERRDLYVVEQGGRVILIDDGEVSPQPFLDITEDVTAGGEQGLFSIAFAADYERSGRFYVDFTDNEGDTRVWEFRRSESDPSVADPGTRRELLFVDQPFPNHNGGLLLFGPDDKLYIGLGDGGSAGDPMRNGQDLGTLLGKILRIDPLPSGDRPYGIPSTNPFVGEADARPEIFAYGLRNPWRFSFDRIGGALSIGDVGQDAIEEIDLVTPRRARGANFGWSAFEGEEPFNEDQDAPNHIPPVLTYPLEGGNCAVTGGYVVRDESLRSLYGRYLYGDFCAGELRSFIARPGEPAEDDRTLGVQVPQLSSFAEDGRGRIYATSLDGPVYRLEPE